VPCLPHSVTSSKSRRAVPASLSHVVRESACCASFTLSRRQRVGVLCQFHFVTLIHWETKYDAHLVPKHCVRECDKARCHFMLASCMHGLSKVQLLQRHRINKQEREYTGTAKSQLQVLVICSFPFICPEPLSTVFVLHVLS
jgi:hypothetical protein